MYLPGRRANAGHCWRLDSVTGKVHPIPAIHTSQALLSAAIRQAVLEAASRRERAAEMRRAVLRMDLGPPDGVNVADELARDRAAER